MTGYIYLITHVPSGRIYVGQTIQSSIRRRWSANIYGAKNRTDCHVDNAIAKYGSKQFTIQVLSEHASQESLNDAERAAIIVFSATDKRFGFNLRSGGSKGKHSEETKDKMRAKMNGRIIPEEVRRRISAALMGRKLPASVVEKFRGRVAWNKGLSMSPDHRLRLSESHRGKHQSAETIAKRIATTQSTMNPERRAKLSAAANRRWHPQKEASYVPIG